MEWERPLDLLEAAYRLDGTDGEWMDDLVASAARVFTREGLGAGGFIVHGKIDEQGHTVIDRFESTRAASRMIKQPFEPWVDAHRTLPAEMQQRLFFSQTQASTVSDVTGLGQNLPTTPFWIHSGGWDPALVHDAVGLVGHEGPLGAVMLAIGLKQPTTFTPRAQRLGDRLAAHIGAAFRMRRRRDVTPDKADAVLSPYGRVWQVSLDTDDQAVGEAFARRRHGRRRGADPDGALEVWQGLHDGRWSLVDYIDTDRKAFVLAVRNEPARNVPSALTDRQRAAVALAALGYGNKQIAYALGLTATAVAMLLARARAVIGVRTRAELVRAFKRTLSGVAR